MWCRRHPACVTRHFFRCLTFGLFTFVLCTEVISSVWEKRSKYSIFKHHIFLFHFILIVSVIINENLDTGFVKLSSLPVSAVQVSSQMRPWWAGSPADTKGPAMCFCSWRVAEEFDKDVKHTHTQAFIYSSPTNNLHLKREKNRVCD